ncbi:MAG: hypothetical protein HYS12_22205 [Planctomycetes bacterium]|nr:hypothetical protein [Planctomycetota bacterium]
MAKKKHQDAEVGTEPVGGYGMSGGASGLPKDKTQAVKLALRDGIKSPTGIAEHVKTTYGMDITPNYVSVIKGKMKRGRKAKGKAKQAQAEGSEKAAPRAGAGKRGLAPEDIVELAGLAHKAGGYDKLREFLTALNRIK